MNSEYYALTVREARQFGQDLLVIAERAGQVAERTVIAFGHADPRTRHAIKLADAVKRLRDELADGNVGFAIRAGMHPVDHAGATTIVGSQDALKAVMINDYRRHCGKRVQRRRLLKLRYRGIHLVEGTGDRTNSRNSTASGVPRNTPAELLKPLLLSCL